MQAASVSSTAQQKERVKLSDTTNIPGGLYPICGESEAFEIRGKNYKFGVISLPAGFNFVNLINNWATWGVSEGKVRFDEIFTGSSVKAQTMSALVLGFPYVENLVYNWLAPIMTAESSNYKEALKPDDFKNPELFDIEGLLVIVENLGKHPGLLRFFQRFSNLSASPITTWANQAAVNATLT